MKLKDLIELNDLLITKKIFDDVKGNVRFSLALAKNKKIISENIELIRKRFEPNETFIEYEKKRHETAQKYAKQGKNNEFLIENNSYVFTPENKILFENDIKELKESYKDAITNFETTQQEYLNSLDEDLDINFNTIEESDLPELTVKQSEIILNFLK